MSEDEHGGLGAPALEPGPRRRGESGAGAVTLTEPSGPKFQFAEVMAGGRRATTQPWDPVIRVAVVVGFAAVVVTFVNRLDGLRPYLDGAPFPFFLGAVGSGVCFVAYALMSARRCRTAHTRFAERGGDKWIDPDPEGCRWTTRAWEVTLSWPVVDEIFDIPGGLGIRAGLPTLWVVEDARSMDLDRGEARIASWREGARA